jgi:site-specific recombinase XerD
MRSKGSNVERSTVNTELRAIKRIFNRAFELNYAKENPARNVKLLSTTRKNSRFFREEKAALILDCHDVCTERRPPAARSEFGHSFGHTYNIPV